MRRLLVTLLCIAGLSTGAFAQDDHRDLNAIQVGYAVVTPTSGIDPFGIPGGLTVFETFGFRNQVPALQAGVLPATMTTRMVLFATAGIRLSRNVGVGITNPADTSVDVTMTLRRKDGSITSTKTVTVAARQQVAKFISELFSDVPEVPRDFDGSLTLTSPTPVAIVGLRFLGAKFSTIPITSLSTPISLPEMAPGVGGRNAVLLPQFASDGRWASEMIVLNNNASNNLTVRIDLFKQDGSPLTTILNRQSGNSFQNLVIPPGGIIMFSPRNTLGDSDF
jgi:hypothetical protein